MGSGTRPRLNRGPSAGMPALPVAPEAATRESVVGGTGLEPVSFTQVEGYREVLELHRTCSHC